MSRRIGGGALASEEASFMIVSEVSLRSEVLFDPPPVKVGEPVTLSVTRSCGGHPAVAVTTHDQTLGLLPCPLGIALAEGILMRGRDLRCWVEASGVEGPPLSDSVEGIAWVQVRITGDPACDHQWSANPASAGE